MNNIFIAAHARSGSSLLCHLLGGFNEISTYMEIFHFNSDQIKSYFSGQWSQIEQGLGLDCETNELRDELIKKNQAYLKQIGRINSEKIVVFKVFPNHLQNKPLTQVIDACEMVIVLKRNLLHSYISNEIASKIKMWGGVDTTEKKVKFSSAEFLQHVERVSNYYDFVKKHAAQNDIELKEVNYEDIVSSDNQMEFVKQLIVKKNNVSISGAQHLPCKQDKRPYATDKVANEKEMMGFLRKYNLEKINDSKVTWTGFNYK